MDKNYSLSEIIKNTPGCFICSKPLQIYYNFYISYSASDSSHFNGLGEMTWKLKVVKDELCCKIWKFDINSGKLKTNVSDFNKTLNQNHLPRLILKCKTCYVKHVYYPQFNWIKTYDHFPENKLSTQVANFNLNSNLYVQILKTSQNKSIMVCRTSDAKAVYHTNSDFDFSDTSGFSKLKNKLKMLITFA